MKLFNFSVKEIDWNKKLRRGVSLIGKNSKNEYIFQIDTFGGKRLLVYPQENYNKKEIVKLKSLFFISIEGIYQINVNYEGQIDQKYVFFVRDVSKLQRRQHYREYVYGKFMFLELEIDSIEDMFAYRSLIVADKLDILKFDNEGVILNISGGGFLLTKVKNKIKKKYLIGYLDIFKFHIPALCEVVRCNEKEEKYGVKFIFISDEYREKIIHEIFELQRLFISSLKNKKDEENEKLEE